jgi:hypothetical protein
VPSDTPTYSPGGNQTNNEKQLQELISKIFAKLQDLENRISALEHP